MILVGHIHVPVLFNNGCVATALKRATIVPLHSYGWPRRN